jgi:chitin disaccharide deacetylase
MERRLIVNADDFGLSEDVNSGILKAHRQGIVTSASLMVRWPAAQDAVNRAEDLDLGLHLDLGEWVYRDGEWRLLYQRAPFDDVQALRAEIGSQLARFQSLTGKDPSHLDSHQHVHLQEPLRSLVKQMAEELAIPLRAISPEIRYCGSFYGQTGKGESCPDAISLAAMIELLQRLPPGVTELACHPGSGAELNSTYCRERELEVQVLCHPRVRQTLLDENIRLCTFKNLATTMSVAQPLDKR